MHRLTVPACAALSLVAATSVSGAERLIVVTLTNQAPAAGTFQTPVWVGFHDGLFDTYDDGSLADSLPFLGSDALERIAEDGNSEPLSNDFTSLAPGGVQRTILSNGDIPPLAPGQSVSRLFRVDDSNRYFSYASMVIPSNDAFIANGSPTAHPIFAETGPFIGEDFSVLGTDVNDAGTEVNDEVPANTAFFGQSVPDTGVVEGVPVAAHPGYIPGGPILSDPMFANADFRDPGYEMLHVSFTPLRRNARFSSTLTPDAEVQDDPVESDGFGIAVVRRPEGQDEIRFLTVALNLSGPVIGAHLHLAREGENGPVVVDLTAEVMNIGPLTQITARIDDADVLGVLGALDDSLDSLAAEMAGGQIYINLHTDAYPDGELRGQVELIVE